MVAKTRKTNPKNVAMVYNPARKISAGVSRTANPVKKRRRRSNPAAAVKKVNASSHRRRTRRSNPSTVVNLIVAALFAGLGVSIFDILMGRLMPSSGAVVRIGAKLGGAYLFQSKIGNSVPLLGKYKNEIALVLAVSGVVDAFKLWLLPSLNQMTGGLLAPAQTLQVIPAADAGGGEGLGDDYYYAVQQTADFDDEDEEYY